ncbi:MAG: hypothetical protein ABSH48_05850 [Verrucomicrobiota bacterium]
MKTKMTIQFFTGSVLLALLTFVSALTGCVSKPTALAPVGPNAAGRTSTAPAVAKGRLLVFSATEKGLPFASDDPVRFNVHTDYDITDAAGHVRYVPNHASNMDEWPDIVTLPSGDYTVVAQSSSRGLVRVPVIIENGRTTSVHLDD